VEIGNFTLFFFCDLDLDSITIYELCVSPRDIGIPRMIKNELSMSRLSKVIVLHTVIHRCHQKHYHASLRVVMKHIHIMIRNYTA